MDLIWRYINKNKMRRPISVCTDTIMGPYFFSKQKKKKTLLRH